MNSQKELLKKDCTEGLGESTECSPNRLGIPHVIASIIKESKPIANTENSYKIIRTHVECEYDEKLLILGNPEQMYFQDKSSTIIDPSRYYCTSDKNEWCQPAICQRSCKKRDNWKKWDRTKEGKDSTRYVQHKYEYDYPGETMRKVLLQLNEKRFKVNGTYSDRMYWPWDFPAGENKPSKPVPNGNMTNEALEQCLLERLEYNLEIVTSRYYITLEYLLKVSKKFYANRTAAFESDMAHQVPAPVTLLVYREEIDDNGNFLFFLDEFGYILDIIKDTGRPASIAEDIKARFSYPETVRYIVTEPNAKLIRLLGKVFCRCNFAVDPWRIIDAYNKLMAGNHELECLSEINDCFEKYEKLLGQKSIFFYYEIREYISNLFNSLIKTRKKYKHKPTPASRHQELTNFLNSVPDFAKVPSELPRNFIFYNGISFMLEVITGYINKEENKLSLTALKMKYRDWPKIKDRSDYCQFERRTELVGETALEKIYNVNSSLAIAGMRFAEYAITGDPVRLMQMRFDHKQVNIFLFWLYFPYIHFDFLDENSLHTARWGKYFRMPDMDDRYALEYSLSVPKRRLQYTEEEKEHYEEALQTIRDWRQFHEGEKKAAIPATPAKADIILFGHYEGEPIEWYVFDFGDELLLVSRYGLDAVPLDLENKNSCWAHSSLRRWLNGNFYNESFSDEERAEIVTKTKEEFPIITPEFDSISYTPDPVTIPARFEVLAIPEHQTCKPTGLAIRNGAYADGDGDGKYWIRSDMVEDHSGPFYLNENGVLYANDATAKDVCVRPMIWIRRKS